MQPTLKRTAQLAWPLILGNASIPLLGIADTAIAGRMPGAVDLASVALGAAWITLAFWAFSFLRQATSGLTAQAVGRKDSRQISSLLHKGLCLSVGIGCAISLIGTLALPGLLSLANPAESMRATTQDYLSIRLMGAPFVLTLYVLHGWMIGQGQTRLAVSILLGLNLLNIAFNALFGLALDMGARGIALGTLCAEATTAIAVLIGLIRRHPELLRGFSVQGIGQLMQANAWVMGRTLALLAVFTWFNTQSSQMGADSAAINAILLTLLSVAAYSLDGFADAAEIQVGQNLGAGKKDWARLALRSTALCSMGSAVLASLALFALGQIAVLWLVPQPQIAAQVTPWLIWLAPIPLVAWVSYWMDGVYLGINAFKPMAVIMVLVTAGVYFPLNLALAEQGLWGQWASFWAWQVARAALMLGWFWTQLRPRHFSV